MGTLLAECSQFCSSPKKISSLEWRTFQMEGSAKQRKILVGITSSIHVTGIFNYLYLFRQYLSQSIKVIMTENAAQMINPETIELFGTTPLTGEGTQGHFSRSSTWSFGR